MKKYWLVLGIFGWLLTASGQVLGQGAEISTDASAFKELQKLLMPGMVQSISAMAVDMAYDYSQKPVISVMVADFRDQQGREIVIGRDMAAWLRAGLNKEKQFHVYGNRHPLSRSLESVMNLDPSFKPVWQRRLQEYLVGKHNSVLPDLIITGTVSREGEHHLKVKVTFLPFYRKIRMVETESSEEGLPLKEFLSPSLSAEALVRIMTVIPKGRLIVLARLNPKFEQTDPFKETSSLTKDTVSLKQRTGKIKSPWELKSPDYLSCWLDGGERKQPLLQIKDWPPWQERVYQDLFSGFGTDTLWFDDTLEEGPHTFFFSLSPAKDRFKTFSRTIQIKAGVNYYLVFSIGSDAMGEPDMHFQLVVDPERTPLPF